MNDNPFEPWNGIQKDDPFAPWNDPQKAEDPWACWNDPFGHGKYEEEARWYGL